MAYSSIATGSPLNIGERGLDFEQLYKDAGGEKWGEISGMFDPYNPYERKQFQARAAAETAELGATWKLAGQQLGEAWGLQKGQLKEASELQLGQLGETWGQKRAGLGETWGLKRGELGAGARSGLLKGGRAMSAIGRGGLAQSGQATEMGLGALKDIRQQYGRGMQAGKSAYEQAMAGGETAYQQAMAKGRMGYEQQLATGQIGYEQKMALGQQKLGQQQAGIARGLTQDIYGTEQDWERSQRDLLNSMIQAIG